MYSYPSIDICASRRSASSDGSTYCSTCKVAQFVPESTKLTLVDFVEPPLTTVYRFFIDAKDQQSSQWLVLDFCVEEELTFFFNQGVLSHKSLPDSFQFFDCSGNLDDSAFQSFANLGRLLREYRILELELESYKRPHTSV